MKKLISILLCITVFALSSTGIVFAGSEAGKNQEIVINEFDYLEIYLVLDEVRKETSKIKEMISNMDRESINPRISSITEVTYDK